jgi:hypothetical protein
MRRDALKRRRGIGSLVFVHSARPNVAEVSNFGPHVPLDYTAAANERERRALTQRHGDAGWECFSLRLGVSA